MKKLGTASRITIALCALAMIATYYLPLWQIQLWAPQYPEGLNMKIFHNKLGGAFDIINGLNHYIGMREIKAEMFPEFEYIGKLIGIFIGVGLLTAIFATRAWLIAFVGLSFVYGAAALWDFYRWGYDYGHNLDPHAAIQVPGMSYQPPVIGYKNLLNFTAYSGPDTGGWIIIAASVIAVLVLIYEIYLKKIVSKKSQTTTANISIIGFVFAASFISCSTAPENLRFGKDQCHHCKMTLTDQRFGAEIVSDKGKIYKFDDLNCLINFIEKEQLSAQQIARTLAVDFKQPGTLIDVEHAFFLQNEHLKSPMRADIATFSTEAARKMVIQQLDGGVEMNWQTVKNQF